MGMIRILGAGGHAKIALEAWRSGGGEVRALHDDDERRRGEIVLGVPIEGALRYAADGMDLLHIAIGDNGVRERLAAGIEDGRFPTVIHAASVISASATLSPGMLVCAGAIIQADARIGRHTIINSRALVEHDVDVGDFVHIAPGVLLAGGVRIGAKALIGIGATIMPNIAVGEGAIVGAGALVSRDVDPGSIVVGVPARNAGRAQGL